MNPLQERLDTILYPNKAEDAATVRALIGRFGGREGTYYLQTGPGFTRRRLAPPLMELEPRVLHFAQLVATSAEAAPAQPGVTRLGGYSTFLFGQT